eukprot:SAG11_NODE_50309_length_114_cov_127.266667_1_plen_37_part_11
MYVDLCDYIYIFRFGFKNKLFFTIFWNFLESYCKNVY